MNYYLHFDKKAFASVIVFFTLIYMSYANTSMADQDDDNNRLPQITAIETNSTTKASLIFKGLSLERSDFIQPVRIINGDQIKTDDTSEAEIQFDIATITLHRKTSIKILEQKNTVELISGAFNINASGNLVERSDDSDDSGVFKIEAEDIIIQNLTTLFFVGYNYIGDLEIASAEGRVKVMSKTGQFAPIIISAGYKRQVVDNRLQNETQLTKAEMDSIIKGESLFEIENINSTNDPCSQNFYATAIGDENVQSKEAFIGPNRIGRGIQYIPINDDTTVDSGDATLVVSSGATNIYAKPKTLFDFKQDCGQIQVVRGELLLSVKTACELLVKEFEFNLSNDAVVNVTLSGQNPSIRIDVLNGNLTCVNHYGLKDIQKGNFVEIKNDGSFEQYELEPDEFNKIAVWANEVNIKSEFKLDMIVPQITEVKIQEALENLNASKLKCVYLENMNRLSPEIDALSPEYGQNPDKGSLVPQNSEISIDSPVHAPENPSFTFG